ncbi:MAG: hypothetical protein OEY86_11435 [Nitrospira sp.]|nr:hypothetical protein [Nitrospira sp.]
MDLFLTHLTLLLQAVEKAASIFEVKVEAKVERLPILPYSITSTSALVVLPAVATLVGCCDAG